MVLIVESFTELPDGVRFIFRAPTDYSLELFPGASYTGMERIDLRHEGSVVASYDGHDAFTGKLPQVHLEGTEDQADLARCLEAIKGYVFFRLFEEQTAGGGRGRAARLWHIVCAAEYDLQVLRSRKAVKCQNHKTAARR